VAAAKRQAPAKAAANKAATSATAPRRPAAASTTAASSAPAASTPVAPRPASTADRSGSADPSATAAPAGAGTPGTGRRKVASTVLPGERPWTAKELRDIRQELDGQLRELRGEITEAEDAWAALQRDSGEGAGDDQADAGTKTFEREHEMSLAANSRDLLSQVERALQRLDDGTYGICESCGNPIGKARLQAFPRATLCVTCKQREERR
jgi:RNA polymerase-binding protein DksA